MKDGRTYLTDSVPFSCCDPRVRRPCVHHSMRNSFQHTKYDSKNVTVYDVGCTRALSNHYATTVFDFLKLLLACLVVELSLTVVFRYLQTSTDAAIQEEDMDEETRGYLWTVSKKKKPAPPPATKAKGKASPTTKTKATPAKGGKSPVVKTATGARKKEATKSAGKDKNRNNPSPNNNKDVWPQSNYNNMAVEPDNRFSQPTDSADRVTRDAGMVRSMPASATASASRQTSATNATGSTSRQTSGTHLTTSWQGSNVSQSTGAVRSASRQQSHDSITTTRSSATSAARRTGSGYASSSRHAQNISLNNNVNGAALENPSATSVADDQLRSQFDRTDDLPAKIHYPPQQQLETKTSAAIDRQSLLPTVTHAAQRNAEPTRRPELPRPLTPIPIPEVSRAKTAPGRRIPIADYLALSAARRGRRSGSCSVGSPQTVGSVMLFGGGKCTSRNNVSTQPPPAIVHKPVVAQPLVGVHDPSNYRIGPTWQESTTVLPPPLPPRNAPQSANNNDSPYVMMYPLRPPRDHANTTTSAHIK